MIITSFVLFIIFCISKPVVTLEEDCVDYFGNVVSHGEFYVPGPNVCSSCVCYHSQPLWCKSTFCEPPYYCKKFRIGERCCEYECLDSPEEIFKEKERLRKRKKFLGIYFYTSDGGRRESHAFHLIISVAILIKAI